MPMAQKPSKNANLKPNHQRDSNPSSISSSPFVGAAARGRRTYSAGAAEAAAGVAAGAAAGAADGATAGAAARVAAGADAEAAAGAAGLYHSCARHVPRPFL